MIMNKDLPKIMFRGRHRNKVKVISLHLQFVNIAKTLIIIWIMSLFPYYSRLKLLSQYRRSLMQNTTYFVM